MEVMTVRQAQDPTYRFSDDVRPLAEEPGSFGNTEVSAQHGGERLFWSIFRIQLSCCK